MGGLATSEGQIAGCGFNEFALHRAWTSRQDLSMGYYHFKLSEELSELCAFMLPWGEGHHCGLSMSPLQYLIFFIDIAQIVLSSIFHLAMLNHILVNML